MPSPLNFDEKKIDLSIGTFPHYCQNNWMAFKLNEKGG